MSQEQIAIISAKQFSEREIIGAKLPEPVGGYSSVNRGASEGGRHFHLASILEFIERCEVNVLR